MKLLLAEDERELSDALTLCRRAFGYDRMARPQ